VTSTFQTCKIGNIGFDLLQPWHDHPVYDLDHEAINPVAAQAIACLPRGDPRDMIKLMIYTDGSGGSAKDENSEAAWASCFFGMDSDGELYYCGHLAERVSQSGLYAQNLDALTNNSAEYSAVIWAILYALQIPGIIAVDIITDSQITMGTAEAVFSAHNNASAASLLAELWMIITHIKVATMFHVYSHMEDPFNELADSVASLAALGRHTTPLPPNVKANLHHSVAWQWEWLRHADQATRDAYPAITSNRFLFSPLDSVPQASARIKGPKLHYQHGEKITKDPVNIHLKLVTINARSLNPDSKQSLNGAFHDVTTVDTGKAQAYRSQFLDEKKPWWEFANLAQRKGHAIAKPCLCMRVGLSVGIGDVNSTSTRLLPMPPVATKSGSSIRTTFMSSSQNPHA